MIPSLHMYVGDCSRHKASIKGLAGVSVEEEAVEEAPQLQFQCPNPPRNPRLTAIPGTDTPSQRTSGWPSAVLDSRSTPRTVDIPIAAICSLKMTRCSTNNSSTTSRTMQLRPELQRSRCGQFKFPAK